MNIVEKENKKILIFVPRYLPGYKAGGPIRTVENLVEQLGELFEFFILTTDRDLGDSQPYKGIKTEEWVHVGKAKVYYMPPDKQGVKYFVKAIKSVNTSLFFFNSFFEPRFTILPLLLRRFGIIEQLPFIVAPRGEFAKSALALKSKKKKIFIFVANLLRIYYGAVWQAESEAVKEDIMKVVGVNSRIVVAPDLPGAIRRQEVAASKKEKGKLNVVFLSRIARMKNLDGALKMMKPLQGIVNFSIYGPQEDNGYWEECRRIIKQLPSNIKVNYYGNVQHENVVNTISNYDLFFLPTLGEGYGHVINEALVAGCPVLISDRTPWRDLENKGIGWDIPLEDHERFTSILQRCIDMTKEEHSKLSIQARGFGEEHARNSESIKQNIELIMDCLK